MLKEFRADLHIHTCLSPCGSLEMSPRAIIQEAKRKGIEVIAICDHNSSENVPPAQRIGRKEGVTVFAGMEVTTKEEIHLLTIFDEIIKLNHLQEIIYQHILPGEYDENVFGPQVIVNEEDEVLGINKRFLIGATDLSINELIDITRKLDSLIIASHVDRESFSLLGHLGFIPQDLRIDALEISPFMSRETAKIKFPQIDEYPVVSFSDAHSLEDVGKTYTCFLLAEPSIPEIALALRGEGGRRIVERQ